MSGVGKDGKKLEPSHVAGGNVEHEVVQMLWKSLAVLRKVKQLLCDPAIPLIGIYPREMKACPHNNCTQMFTGALVIIAKKWK